MINRGDLPLVAMLAAVCSCGGPAKPPPPPMPFAPLPSWPQDPVVAPLPSLTVAPAVVWTIDTEAGPIHENDFGIALSGDNIIVAAGRKVVAVDRRSGAEVWTVSGLPAAPWEFFSAAVVDADGNILVNRYSAALSFDSAGTVRWERGWDAPPNDAEGIGAPPGILSPAGIFYAHGGDGQLHALRTTDGASVWVTADSSARVGAGDFIVGYTNLMNAATGNVLGQYIGLDGIQVVAGAAASYAGILAFRVASSTKSFVDVIGPNGQASWQFESSTDFLHVDLVGSKVYLDGDPASPTARQGRILALDDGGIPFGDQPTISGSAVAIGADETVYVIDCVHGTTLPATLIAFTPELNEKWRLPVGTRCNVGNALLTDDGMLYFARLGSFVELVAVQTTSPGLAKTAWPSARHDNRATGWLGAPEP